MTKNELEKPGGKHSLFITFRMVDPTYHSIKPFSQNIFYVRLFISTEATGSASLSSPPGGKYCIFCTPGFHFFWILRLSVNGVHVAQIPLERALDCGSNDVSQVMLHCVPTMRKAFTNFLKDGGLTFFKSCISDPPIFQN